MPYVISSTIVSFFATMIFNPTIGFLNTFFEKMGWNNLVSAWVGNPKLAFKIMIALVLWRIRHDDFLRQYDGYSVGYY